MKYCPYCGASVLDDAVSFCSECGENIKSGKTKDGLVKKTRVIDSESTKREKENKSDGYDGYYEDIIPTDTGKLNEGIDLVLIKKIGVLIAGVLIVIGLSIAVMYLI